MTFNPKNYVWTKKYQPDLKDYVGEDIKNKVLPYLKDIDSVPNFIFESKNPGTGKTSLGMAIIKELGCSSLILNSANERNIGTIRDKVLQFAKTVGINGKKKCVLMDEADGMGRIAQEALKPIMERFTTNVFFILTVNNINELIEPIRDRCKVISFASPPKTELNKYIIDICDREKMDYTDEGIANLIEIAYPSIRNIVLFLQDLKTRELDLVKENVKPNLFIYEEMFNKLIEKDHHAIKEKILSTDINPRELNNFFWEKAVETDNVKLIQLTCINERDMSQGADPKIIFVSSLIEMVK